VQCKVSQLVAKGTVYVSNIGAQQDGAGAGEGDGSSPSGRSALGQRVQLVRIGNDDQAEWSGRGASESRPFGGLSRAAGEVGGQAKLVRPGYRRYLTNPYRLWLILKRRAERCSCDEEEF